MEMPFTNDCHVASEKFHLKEISFTDDYHISRRKFQLSLEENFIRRKFESVTIITLAGENSI